MVHVCVTFCFCMINVIYYLLGTLSSCGCVFLHDKCYLLRVMLHVCDTLLLHDKCYNLLFVRNIVFLKCMKGAECFTIWVRY